MDGIRISTPISDEAIKGLCAGDVARITGVVYTARDAAHKRFVDMLKNGEKPPFKLKGQAVYYAGPCPAPPGRPIGAIGPTTSGRMDAYSPILIERGLKVMIGKGLRDQKVIDAIKMYTGVYFTAIGGAAALMCKHIKSASIIAFEDLGTEAVRELYVEDLPVVVAIDCRGGSVYDKRL